MKVATNHRIAVDEWNDESAHEMDVYDEEPPKVSTHICNEFTFCMVVGVVNLIMFGILMAVTIQNGKVHKVQLNAYKNTFIELSEALLLANNESYDVTIEYRNLTRDYKELLGSLNDEVSKRDTAYNTLEGLYELDYQKRVTSSNDKEYKLKMFEWNLIKTFDNRMSVNNVLPNGDVSYKYNVLNNVISSHMPFSIASFKGVSMKLVDILRDILPKYYHIHYCSTLHNNSNIFDESAPYNLMNVIVYNSFELTALKRGEFNINSVPKSEYSVSETGCVSWGIFNIINNKNIKHNKLMFLSTHIDSPPGLFDVKQVNAMESDTDTLQGLIHTVIKDKRSHGNGDNMVSYLNRNPMNVINDFVNNYNDNDMYIIMTNDWNEQLCLVNMDHKNAIMNKNKAYSNDWIDLQNICQKCDAAFDWVWIDDDDSSWYWERKREYKMIHKRECKNKWVQFPFMINAFENAVLSKYKIDDSNDAKNAGFDAIPVEITLKLL